MEMKRVIVFLLDSTVRACDALARAVWVLAVGSDPHCRRRRLEL